MQALIPEEINGFLVGSAPIEFTGQSRVERYAWIETTLRQQQYFSLSKKQRGGVRALLCKVSGLSVPQLTRLIRSYRQSGAIGAQTGSRRRFPVKYNTEDLELLIEVDRAHQRLSGPATRRILEREWHVFGKREYARLAEISVAHLYNLRHSAGYRQRASEFTLTTPSGISIGERRRPDPQGSPGYLRVDTVHQGDWEGAKGVYHINAVDAVTQWEIVGCVAKISEQHLLPVLEAMLHQFPFLIVGFHSDNGSEFVNHTVAKLQIAGGIHSLAAQPQLRQRLGGGQERSDHSQAHRLRAHCQPTRRPDPTLLYGAFQPVLELSPSLWFRPVAVR